MFETVKNGLYKNIWGKHSLKLGEAIVFTIAFLLMYFNWLGKWSFWIGMIMILVATAIF